MVKATSLLSLAATTLLSVVLAAPQPATDVTYVPGAYIVEFEDGHDYTSFYTSLSRSSIEAVPRMNLNYRLFKGASFNLKNTTLSSTEDVAVQIAAAPEIKSIWPVRLFSRPNPKVHWTAGHAAGTQPLSPSLQRRLAEKADTYSPHVMTQVDKLRAEGITGKGLRVAVVDTGIDYMHPDLGGGFGPGHLVSYGTDLVGDDYNGENTPKPDDDPMDECEGHGTHVAGIIAAQPGNAFGFSGNAPGVTLGAYRVIGCDGSVANDVVIAAYNRAYEDGSDIITCSVGDASGWSEEPVNVAMQRIVEAGVPWYGRYSL